MNTPRFVFLGIVLPSVMCVAIGCSSAPPEPDADLAHYYSKRDILEIVPMMVSDPGEAPGQVMETLAQERVPLNREFSDEEVELQKQIDALVVEISEMDPGNTTEIVAKLNQVEELGRQLPDPSIR